MLGGGNSPARGMMIRRKAETPRMSRAGTWAEPGPLCSTAPSTIIMHGIMGVPSTCHDTPRVSSPLTWRRCKDRAGAYSAPM